MRILAINYEFPPLGGGAGNATACLAREWAKAGHEVEILTGGFRDLPRVQELDGYTIRRICSPRRHQGQCSVLEMCSFLGLSLLPVLRRGSDFRPDVAIAFFSIPSGPAAWLLKAARGTPYVVSLRGGDVPGFDARHMGQMHAITAPITSLIWRDASAVVANSGGLRGLASAFARDLPIAEIPNGVDTQRFSPGDRATQRSGPVELLFVGRLAKQKGLDVLLDALHLLPNAAWRLRIVGDGPERAALENQATHHGMANRVIFHGWAQRDELAELYRGSDVFVFPSNDEGMPNVLLEALACGLPVVATRVAGNEELISLENGFLVPPRDPTAFAAALAPLINEPALRVRLGKRSRELAVEKYAWSTAARAYEAIFRDAISAAAAHGGAR
jgi:glycosyltransferase involved in cell wall biosynthesis